MRVLRSLGVGVAVAIVGSIVVIPRLLRFVPLPELIIVAVIAIIIFGPREFLRLGRWRRG